MRCWALIGVLSCLGCGTTTLDYTPTRKAAGPLRVRSAEQVEVFMTVPPKRPHVELGLIESQSKPGSADQGPELIAKMRALAGQHGCDGLVIVAMNDTVSETMLVQGGGSRVYTLPGYRASCIVYSAGSAASVQAAPVPPPACVPNATQVCYGPAACRGGQSCTADGRGWTRCDCGSAPPPF